jgi:acyl-CoA synthetase (NDP forming)
LKEAVKGRGTRLLGPNTLGVYTPGVVDTMFLDTDRCRRPGKGQIALIMQSGATATILMDSCSLYNIGFSAFVGIGNRADIGENELISHFSKDEDVRAIALYLESFADAKEFLEIAKSIDKPLVVLKAGRSEWGSRAALSHTGSLVRSSEKVVEGIFKQYGITRALDEIELIDYAKALAYSAPIHGDRIAILTSAGGPGVIAADYLKDWDLTLAKLEERTKNELKRIALPFASVENPVDLTASLTSSSWKRALEILAKAKEVDAILALTFLQPPGMDESSIDALKALKERKPIVSVSIGSEYTLKILKRCEELKIPAYPSIERGVKVLKILAERGKFLQR